MKKKAQLIGFAMLLYLGIEFAVEFAIMFAAEIVIIVPLIIKGEDISLGMEIIQQGWFLVITTILAAYIAAPLSAWLLLRKKPNGQFLSAKQKSKLTFGKVLECGCVSIGTLYVFAYLSEGILWVTAKIFNTTTEQLNAVNQMSESFTTFQYILMVCICAPIIEELFFRGFIIKKMIVHGELAAIVVSAFVFGMVHGTLSQIPYALAVGLVFGYIYIRFGNIFLNIGLHMFLNFMGGVFGMLIEDLPYADEISMAIIIGFIVAAVIILIVKRKDIKINTVDNAEGLSVGQQIKTVLLNPGMIIYTVVCVLVMLLNLAVIIVQQWML